MYLPVAARDLEKRYNSYNCRRYGGRYCRSTFSRWGRWVLAGILIAFGILLILIFLCMARRRRSRASRMNTSTPMVSNPPNGGYKNDNVPPQAYNGGYNAPQQEYNAPPGPPPPNFGNHPGANADYYGGQTGGVTQPGQTYQPGYGK